MWNQCSGIQATTLWYCHIGTSMAVVLSFSRCGMLTNGPIKVASSPFMWSCCYWPASPRHKLRAWPWSAIIQACLVSTCQQAWRTLKPGPTWFRWAQKYKTKAFFWDWFFNRAACQYGSIDLTFATRLGSLRSSSPWWSLSSVRQRETASSCTSVEADGTLFIKKWAKAALRFCPKNLEEMLAQWTICLTSMHSWKTRTTSNNFESALTNPAPTCSRHRFNHLESQAIP